MSKFIKATLLYIFYCLVGVYIIFSFADGSSDAFYLKFTSPQQSNLIIGSSRAAQSIVPSTIKEKIGVDFYNYGFTIAHTPYGRAYYKSIEKKLDKSTDNGIFLLCVNPWTLSAMTANPEDSLHFREVGSFIDKTNFVNLKPNVEYLVESYTTKYADILLNKGRVGDYQTFFVHDDGWLEVTIESDMISSEARIKNKVNSYQKKLRQYSGISQNRLGYLSKTITLLQQHGTVYLVRIPVNEDFYQLELELEDNFDSLMLDISKKHQIDYLNFIDERSNYQYTDGHHLDIPSAKRFSALLAQKIVASQ